MPPMERRKIRMDVMCFETKSLEDNKESDLCWFYNKLCTSVRLYAKCSTKKIVNLFGLRNSGHYDMSPDIILLFVLFSQNLKNCESDIIKSFGIFPCKKIQVLKNISIKGM